MIIGENFLFIHTPKSGGMSFTRWLINNVDGRLWVVVPESAFEHSQQSALFDDIPNRLTFVKGTRHETLPEARKLLDELGCPEPEFIFSAIRDPFDLLRSYYNYIKKPHVVKRRNQNDPDLKLALNNDFETFAANCNFFGRDEKEIIEYFDHPNSFKQVDAIPLEDFTNYLNFKFSNHKNYGRYNLETRNSTSKPKIRRVIEKRIRSHIYERFDSLHDLYIAACEQAKIKNHWNIEKELDEKIKKVAKRNKTQALLHANELIDQLRKERENKNLQIDSLRQTLSLVQNSHDKQMSKFRDVRKKTLIERDKEIERLKTEKDKRTEVMIRRGKEIDRLKADRMQALTKRDKEIKRLKVELTKAKAAMTRDKS